MRLALPDRPRVLLTGDTVGGVFTFVLDLARELSARGAEVCLATLGGRATRQQRDQVRRIPGLQLFDSAYRLEWMDEPWDDLRRAEDWLLGIADDVEPDLVHLNHYGHGALDWGLPVVLTAHSCVLSWWEAVHHEPAPPAWDRYRALVREAVQRADVVVAPSAAMRSAVARWYGRERDTRVIYNGRRQQDFRRQLKQPVIFSAGRLWDEAKNIAALDRVAPRVAWPIVVAGSAAAPGGSARELRNVRTLGRLEPAALAERLAAAAIYAFPARYEPFGLSVLEAALSGCALVLGDIPSLRELWNDAAVFVPPDDEDRLAHALNELASDAAQRHALAKRALRRAAAYHPGATADGYERAYAAAFERAARAASTAEAS